MTIIWQKNELLQALKEILLEENIKDENYGELAIDNRKATKNSIFVALKGENNDGHNFIEASFASGSTLAIFDQKAVFEKLKNKLPLILVKDSLKAIWKLAEFKRKNSQAKFIAVTGSAGKTSVKEMLKLVFASQGKTYATTGNLNNHIGLPLTLANMPQDTEFAILEMGMNHLNEINILSDLAKPDVSIITIIAPAHIGNFNNEEEIAIAKSEIFSGLNKNNGFAIINADNKYYDFLKNRAQNFYQINEKNIFSFGKNSNSSYQLESVEISNVNELTANTKFKNKKISYKISSSNKTTAFNSLMALACLDLVGNDLEKGLDSLKQIKAIAGRGVILEINKNNKNLTIIDDSYNANVASIAAGIEYLSDLKTNLKKNRSVAILGDMLELGKDSTRLHKEIAKYLQQFKIDFVLLAGAEMKHLAGELGEEKCKSFTNSTELALVVENFLEDEDVVLIKGSRGMKMENVIASLQQN